MTLTWTQIDEEHRTCPVHGNGYVAHRLEFQITDTAAAAKRRDRGWKMPPPHWTNCPVCNQQYADEAKESQLAAEGGLIYVQRKREAAEGPTSSMVANRLAAAGVPARFQRCSLKNWQHPMDNQRRCWEWAMSYTEAFRRDKGTLNVFLGSPGTGKTHLAAAILADVLVRKISGAYVTVMGMLRRIRNSYNATVVETEQQVIDALVEPDLLVIDEVGKAMPTEFSMAQVFDVVDMRHGSNRHTLLISNLSLKQFKDLVGDAKYDRVREGGGKILPFDWGSYRSRRR